MAEYTRRELLRIGALTAGAFSVPLVSNGCRPTTVPSAPGGPDFTVAFLTDMHVHAEQGAGEGFAKALRHAVDRPDRPAFVLSGGDQPFDILRTDVAAADAQYDLWDAALSGVPAIEIHPTLGNHDVLGLYPESPLDAGHPLFGKAYFLRRFGLERTYYSFDWEGWHFVVLDSIGIDGDEYLGSVDAEQIAWLRDDLAASGRPTVITTHIPLLTNYIELRRGTSEPIPPGVAIVNAHEVIAAIEDHPVKLVLGGHLHINESFRYKGTEYANVGAVSGNWWNGPRDGFEEGYARLDFRGDEVSWTYVDYGWEAQAATESAA